MTTWCDAKTAVQVVESGDRVYLHGRHSTPTPLIEALVARGEELQDVELLPTLSFGPVPYTDPRWVGHFRVNTIFVGASEREAVNAGRASYAPTFLSYMPNLFKPGGPWPIDVALIQVSPPDKYGYCSLGPSVDVTREVVDNARQVVALVNPQVPRAHGDSFVPVSRLDYAVKWDGPLHEVGQQAPNQMQREIGRYVAELIEDGATLQLGIGAIPDAVLQALTDRRDLGIHSEMFSDGVLDLVERGVITGARKTIDRGKMVASFIIGSRRLMDFLDDNPMVELRSVSYTNDIENIRQFDHMVAVNSALEVDLTGQVCAETIGTTQYSGVGGQIDFLQGAADAPRGRPVLAFPATAHALQTREGNMPYELPSIDGQVSRIVPTLTPGSAVTTTRAHVHYVVTEYGRVMLFGRSTADRARLLISIAAPQFREQLEQAAYDLHLLYR
ncbi:MAG TPA: acetyl-CoA hydrolase/transferase C-terminal domain-containing protein [Ktedonobacteraceae bacterium]